MASDRKYAALPDLDSAPDVYETPDLTESTSTVPPPLLPRPLASANPLLPQASNNDPLSPTASPHDPDTDHEHIDRHVLRPAAARTHFSRSRVDARRADFSDRLGDAAGQGYRVALRRARRKGGYEEYEAGPASDDEAAETLEQRIARLRREVEEVRAESERAADGEGAGADAAMQQLGTVLAGLEKRRKTPGEAGHEEDEATPAARELGAPPAVSADFRATLGKATALEERLASLESALGMATAMELGDTPQKSILASISMLETQLSIVSATTAPSLNVLSREIASMLSDSERLAETSKAAARAEDPPASQRPRSALVEPAAKGEAEQQAERVRELHKALPLLERVSPVLPAVIERLRTLRKLHEQSSVAGEMLEALEKRQAQMNGEIDMWRSGLERVEEAMVKAGEQSSSNKSALEQWLRDLEARAQKLE